MKTYFKLCLLSPLWVPFVIGALYLVLFPFLGESAMVTQTLGGLCLFTGAALVFGGLQYVVAMALVWRRIDFDCFGSILLGCVALPIVFTPIQLLPLGFFCLIRGEGLGGLLGFVGLDLMLGYAYVIVWFVVYWLIALFQQLSGREVHYG